MRSYNEIVHGLNVLLGGGWGGIACQRTSDGEVTRIRISVSVELRFRDLPLLAEIFGTEHMNFGSEGEYGSCPCNYLYVEAWA